MKKILIFLTVFVCLFNNSCFFEVKAMENNLGDEYELLCFVDERIAYEFLDNETNTISELNNWIAELDLDNSNNVNSLKNRLESIVDEYEILNSQINNSRSVTNTLIELTYRCVIIKAIAFFYMMQYKFSAECLEKAYNSSGDEFVYSSILYHSKTYIELYNYISTDTNIPSSCLSFEYKDDPIEWDAYFSIHNFSVLEENNTFYIFDVYNFDGNYPDSDIIQNLVQIFENAENRGILIPYNIKIEITVPHSTACSSALIGHNYDCNNELCKLNIYEFIHYFNLEYDFNGHYEKCYKCGFEKNNEAHVFDYRSISTTHHIAECIECGYAINEEHIFVNMPAIPYAQIITKKACSKCGHIFM